MKTKSHRPSWLALVAVSATCMIGTANAQCVDDAFEPNDVCYGAAPITSGSYTGLNIDGGSKDFYFIEVPVGDVIIVNLTFLADLGNINLRLDAPCGINLAVSNTSGDNEHVFWQNSTGSAITGFIQVDRSGLEPCSFYDMLVDVSTPVPCPADSQEPNDSCTTATPIVSGVPLTGLNVDSGPGLVDFFTINVPAGDAIDIDVLFEHDEGNINARLDAPCGAFRAFSSSNSDNERIFWVNDTGVATDAFIRLNKIGPEICSPYDIDVEVFTPPPCPDDFLEPNDSCATAAAIGTGLTTGLNVDAGTGVEDWYTISVPDGDMLDVYVLFSHYDGDVDARLEAPCSFWRGSSTSTTDDESLSWYNNTGAAVDAVIRVDKDGRELCTPYDLNLVLTTQPPCLDDSFEPNETCATAAPISVGLTSGLNLDGGSQDWYTINVPDGNILDVFALFSDADGDIDARLEGPCGLFLAYSDTITDDEIMTWYNDTGTAVDAFIRMDRGGPELCTSYEMNVVLTPPQPCLDDAFEPNDACLSASPITEDLHGGLNLDVGMEDWYSIDVPPNSRIEISAFFLHFDGDLDVLLEAPCGSFQNSGTSLTDNEFVMWSNETGASVPARIRINRSSFGTAKPCTPYSLDVAFVPDPCVFAPDDLFEENDDCGSATVITQGYYPGLLVRKETVDEDWFSITVEDGESITVAALFTHADGDVDMRLWDACAGNLVSTSESASNDEQIFYANNTGGPLDMKLSVYAWNGSSNPAECNVYDFAIFVTGDMPPIFAPYCFGDGSGVACPCGNNSTAGHPGGCGNSNGDGAILSATGTPSVAADSLHFDLSSASPSAFGLLFSAINRLPMMGGCIGCGVPAFDGLRCAGGNFLRHGTRSTDSLGATTTGWGPPAGPPGGLIAFNGFMAGSVRHFSVFYREDATMGCMTGQNSSNGVTVTFLP